MLASSFDPFCFVGPEFWPFDERPLPFFEANCQDNRRNFSAVNCFVMALLRVSAAIDEVIRASSDKSVKILR